MASRVSFTWSLVTSLGLLLGALLAVGGCEAIADFDPKKLNQDRTVGPTPLPSVDGGVPNVPDASVGQDGALIEPETSDAQVAATDAGDAGDVDANGPQDAGSSEDSGAPDAAADAASSVDSGNDAAADDDISFADAGL